MVGPLNHPTPGTVEELLSLSPIALIGTAGTGGYLTINLAISVADDVPAAILGEDAGPRVDTALLDEDALQGGNADGNPLRPGEFNAGGSAIANGDIVDNVSWDADGFGRVTSVSWNGGSINLAANATSATVYILASGALGDPANAAIRLTVGADGSYSFELLRAQTHGESGEDLKALLEGGFTFNAVDGDGDPVEGGVRVNVNVRDDIPVITFVGRNFEVPEGEYDAMLSSQAVGASDLPLPGAVTVDESDFETDDTSAAGTVHFTVSFGADGPAVGGGKLYVLEARTGDATGLIDTATGQPVLIAQGEDGNILGVVTINNVQVTVFEMSVIPTTGEITFDQKQGRAVRHPNADDDNDSVSIAKDVILLRLTATDGDGDAVSATVDVGRLVSIADDGPSISQAADTVLLDEDALQGANADAQPPRAGEVDAGGSASASASGSIVDNVNWGADGFGRVTGVSWTGGSATLAANETSVTVFLNANAQLLGSNTGAVLSLQVFANGNYTVTLLDNLLIAGAGENLVSVLNNGFVFNAVDRDGDPVEGGVRVNVNVQDDIPVAVAERSVTATVAENDIRTPLSTGTSPNDGNADGSFTGDPVQSRGPATVSGSLVSLVSYGADGAAAGGGFGLSNVFTGLTAQNLTSAGAALIYSVNGNTLTATAGTGIAARTVFTLQLQSNGSYTFTLRAPIDHPAGDGENTRTLDLSSAIVATDRDGDALVLRNALSITVIDDEPRVDLRGAGTVAEDAAGTITGTWSVQMGADQPGAVEVRLGGQSHAIGTPITVNVGGQAIGTLTVNVGGTWSFDPNPNLNNPNGVHFTFSIRATDADSDVESDSHKITVTDGRNPSAGAAQTLALDEEALGNANATGTNPASSAEAATATLAFTAGSDDLVGFAFANDLSSLVRNTDGVNGPELTWTHTNATTLTATFANTTNVALTLTLSAPGSIAHGTNGNVTVNATLSDNLRHALAGGEQVLSLGSIGVVATDRDGDAATGTINLSVQDDIPRITVSPTQNLHESFERFVTDETNQSGWFVVGENGRTMVGNDGIVWTLNEAGIEIQRGNVGGALPSDGTHKAELDAHNLAGGSANTLTELSTQIYVPGSTFEMSFDYQPRPAAMTDSTMTVTLGTVVVAISADAQGVVSINAPSGVTATLTATPGAAGWSTISLSFGNVTPGLNTLSFAGTGTPNTLGAYIDNIRMAANNPILVDETSLNVDGSANAGALSFRVDFGADGAAATNARVFSLTATNDTATGLFDTATGQAVVIAQGSNGQILGVVTVNSVQQTVFVMSVNADGVVSFDQQRAVVHGNPQNPNDSVSLNPNVINLRLTATDGDGDAVSATVDVGRLVSIADDGPRIDVGLANVQLLVLTTQDAQTLGTASDTATGNFAGLFSVSYNAGADGKDSLSTNYSLSVGVAATSLSSGGQAISLFAGPNGQLLGSTATTAGAVTASNTVFEISVNPGTGQVTLTQHIEIDHAVSGSLVGLPAGAVLLSASATITDGDDDQASDSATRDISAAFKFEDGTPPVVSIRANPPTVAEDGNDIVTFTVTLDRASATDTVVTIGLGGTATEGADYAAAGLTGTMTRTVTIPANQTSVIFTADPTPDILDEIDETVVATITAATGATVSATAGTATATITDNDTAPTIAAGRVSVSEEGLPNGLPDTTGTSDTTDSAVTSGTLAITRNGSAPLDVTLTGDGLPSTLGGTPITWSGAGTAVLTGSSGNDAVIRITLNGGNTNVGTSGNTVGYQVELLRPIAHPDTAAEDVVSFNAVVRISDGVNPVSTAALAVSIEDDRPAVPQALSATVNESGAAQHNLMFILDLSGSMDDDAEIANAPQTRLAVAKDAMQRLIDTYDGMGDVMVRIVTFSDTASAVGNVWMSAVAAKNWITALANNAGDGFTNFDAALTAAMNAFGSSGKIPSGVNVSYFLSDGEPNRGSDPFTEHGPTAATTGDSGIGTQEQTAWENFLRANDIKSFALGMGGGLTVNPGALDDELDPIAYDGKAEQNLNPIAVTNLAQLNSVLAGTVVGGNTITGNLLTDGNPDARFGADGPGTPRIQSVTLGSAAYTTASPEFVSATQTLTLNVTGGTLTLNFSTGAYAFTSGRVEADTTHNFTYTLVDADGDRSTGAFNLTVRDNEPVANPDTATAREGNWVLGTPENRTVQVEVPGSWSASRSKLNVDEPDELDPSHPGSALTDVTPLFSFDASSTQTALVYYDVNLKGFRTGDTVLVELLNSAGVVVASRSHTADADDQTFTVSTGGSYRLRIVADDNTSSGDLKAELKDVEVDRYIWTAPRMETRTVATPTLAWVAAAAVAGNVLANDAPGVDGAVVSQVTVGSSTLTNVATNGNTVIVGQFGTLSINAQGAFTYTPNNRDNPQGAQDVFSYTIRQPDGDTASANLTVSLTNFAYSTTADNAAQLVGGGDGNDTLNALGGNDAVYGGAGNNTLNGGAGNDLLLGGSGNDTLTGGLGADVFAWRLGDQGSTGTPARDVITDFSPGQGDALDLRDLLQGETAANLGSYLKFGTDSASGKLVLQVDHDGGGTFAPTQNIVFDNFASRAELAQALGLAAGSSEADILNKMRADGHLRTD